ncbi:hypothetical protein RJT34_33097 [Clitoria ternatea]|uniref:Uncharacterized protein n=1 Tax=Clitoria ternatea TaxID=43366 RepID=A0AAN9I4C3_CLITE
MNYVSPLEAQVFNYLSFGFLTLLNNLWTRLALTFTFTFSNIPKPNSQLLLPNSHDSDPAVTPPPSVPSPTAASGAVDVDGAKKGKFTLYYEDECDSDHTDTTVTEEYWKERDGTRDWWWESWETLLKMKLGVNRNGWYTCQDLTSLNGNVVRLWESRDTSSCVLEW